MTYQLNQKERRIERRLPAAELKVQIKSKQGLFSSWLDLKITDFNLFGIGLILSSEPELGNKVTLRLLLKMDMVDLKVKQIEAKIVNKMISEDGEWKVGLIFCNQSKLSNETKVQLRRLKIMLERNEMLINRLRVRN